MTTVRTTPAPPAFRKPCMNPPPPSPLSEFARLVSQQDVATEGFAVGLVEKLLDSALVAGASDIHLQPRDHGDSLDVLWRMNGVLQPVVTIPRGKQNVIARLKVLAELLTYKTDTPQEGRIRRGDSAVEMRLSTFPTIHGEKGVIRLFISDSQHHTLDQLGLPADLLESLRAELEATSGLLLVAGPAGSGKTTTLYACLRHLAAAAPRRGLSSLEDPVEALLPGVAQSQVKPASGFTYATALRSLLRQDPEVILVGEIRDRETADMAFQASLTGHLILTSFHAGTSADAVSRLIDMGIEPFVIRSGLRGILTQRLVRRSCSCARQDGCDQCQRTGYSGRLLIAEFARPMGEPARRAILEKQETAAIAAALESGGMTPLRERARETIDRGLTTSQETARVFGTTGV